VLQRHAGLAWLPMASEEGVGEKMRYAALADTRLVAAGFGLPAYAAKPRESERVSGVGGSAATGKRPEGAALDAGASGAYIASPPSRKTSSGQMQARAAAPERARPRPFPGHGKPSTAVAPRSTEPGQRPMPASREERRPPRQRRDRAADRQDAGTRLWRTSSARAQPWHIPRRRPEAGAPRFWGRTATGAGGAGGGGGRPRGHGRTWGWQARQPPTRRLRRQGFDRERRGAGRGSEHAGRVAGSRECEDPPANGRLPARQRPGGRQPQRSAGARQGPPRARGRRLIAPLHRLEDGGPPTRAGKTGHTSPTRGCLWCLAAARSPDCGGACWSAGVAAIASPPRAPRGS
jgi:hypothetical protein